MEAESLGYKLKLPDRREMGGGLSCDRCVCVTGVCACVCV